MASTRISGVPAPCPGARTTRLPRALAALCFAVLSLPACLLDTSPRDTGDAPTDQIVATISAVDNGSEIDVFVRLTRGLTDLRLSGGDALTARLGDQSIALRERADGDVVHYIGTGPRSSGASAFSVTLTQAERRTTTTSEVTIPAPIKATGLARVIRVGDVVEVSLDRPLEESEKLFVDLLGECLRKDGELDNRVFFEPKAEGASIFTGTVHPLTYAGSERGCPISARVQVTAPGKVDPALSIASGIVGVQERGFSVRLEP